MRREFSLIVHFETREPKTLPVKEYTRANAVREAFDLLPIDEKAEMVKIEIIEGGTAK